jgi:hypothetical protein
MFQVDGESAAEPLAESSDEASDEQAGVAPSAPVGEPVPLPVVVSVSGVFLPETQAYVAFLLDPDAMETVAAPLRQQQQCSALTLAEMPRKGSGMLRDFEYEMRERLALRELRFSPQRAPSTLRKGHEQIWLVVCAGLTLRACYLVLEAPSRGN